MLRIITAAAVLSCVCAVQRAHFGDTVLSDAEQHDLFLADLKTVLTGEGITGAPGTAAHTMTVTSGSGLANLSSLPWVSATEAPADPVQHVAAQLRQLVHSNGWSDFITMWEPYMIEYGLNALNFETYFGWKWDLTKPFENQGLVTPLATVTLTFCLLESCKIKADGTDRPSNSQLCATPSVFATAANPGLQPPELMSDMSFILEKFKALTDAAASESILTGDFWQKLKEATHSTWSTTAFIYTGSFDSKKGLAGKPRQATYSRLGLTRAELEVRTPDQPPSDNTPRSVYGTVRGHILGGSSGVYWQYNGTSQQFGATGMDVELRENPRARIPQWRTQVAREYYGDSSCVRFTIPSFNNMKAGFAGIEGVARRSLGYAANNSDTRPIMGGPARA